MHNPSELLPVGTWVLIAPESVALGFATRGVIDQVTPCETFCYRILWADGSCTKMHPAQIQGEELL